MLKVVQAGDFPATLRRTMRRVLALFVAVSLVLLPLPARADLRVTPVWYDQNAVGTAPDWHYRVPITVPAGTSINSTIKVDVNFNTLLTQMGISGTFDVNSPRVVRPTGVLAATQEFTDAVFAGATDAAGDGKGEVRFILEDAGPATYYLYFDITQNGVKPANPQTPINGNFEKGGTGTGTPPGWNAPTIGIAGGDAQIRPSEVVSVTTTPAPLTGANPRNTDGSPNTGQFSYMLGLRTTNTLAAGTIAFTKTIVVPALGRVNNHANQM